MKKTMIMFGIASIFVAGAALAGDNQPATTQEPRLYNGITYFEYRHDANNQDAARKRPEARLYNGITAFDLGKAKSPEGIGQEKTKMAKLYNGITVF